MFKSIFLKTLYEKRWTMIFWSIGVAAMSLLMMGFFHSFKDGGFDELLNNLPKSFQGLVGDISSLKTIAGYVSQQVFALRIPLLTLIMGIILFTGLLAGDEADGTLQTVLAQPVSRTKIFVQKFLAGALVSLIVCSAAIVGILIGLVLINEGMSFLRLIQAVVGAWLITLVFGTLGFAIGAISGKRGLAGSLTGLIAFSAYLITSFLPNVSGLSTIEKLSPFHYYNKPSIAEYGLKDSNVLLMLVVIAILLVISLVIFRKRDIYQK